MKTLANIVQTREQNYISGTGTLMSKYVTSDLYEDINTIYAYLNSKHISGEYDNMGREKPFFNIVLASRNIWFRATDLDRKDIILQPRKLKDTVGTFLLNIMLQNWMTEERFGVFLNTLGIELAGFNSAVTKFVEKDGRLICSVVPWSRMIVDQINFKDNIKIEILELTEQQMYERGYDKDVIERLCASKQARELINKQKQDNQNDYFKVYEVHGKLPLSYITDKESDEDIFVQQMHVLSFLSKDKQNKEDEEYTLYRGLEEKDPYMLVSLLPSTDGSISLDGSVKNLFNAQWMANHTKKAIKDQLDIASKLMFQTSDVNYVGQNVISAIENGDILVHEVNKPLTSINNVSHDIGALQSYGAEWKQLSSELNGVSEAMLGIGPKSGTAWKQTEALLEESHSLFEIMTENKGLAIEDMLRAFIIPFLKKKLNNADEITATLDMYGVKQLDEKYIKGKGVKNFNEIVKDALLNDKTIETTVEQEMNNVKLSLQEQGGQRFYKPSEMNWKKELKDIETNVEIIITDESKNIKEFMTTLNTALQVIVNPNYTNNPKAQFIIDKLLTLTGHITPIELSAIPETQPNQALNNPQGGEVDVTKALSELTNTQNGK